MKKILLSFCLSLIVLVGLNAQTYWEMKSSGTAENLNDVFFVTSQEGWVVGASGTILHSTDGGETWSAQTSGTSDELLSVGFFDANNGWAGGSSVLLKTTNGGSSWTEFDAGSYSDVSWLQILSSSLGFFKSGSNLYKTTNGGTTWTLMTSTAPSWQLCFIDENIGFEVYGQTDDGGANWFGYGSTPPAMWDAMLSCYFVDENHGWLADGDAEGFYGGGRTFYTTDGGETWNEVVIASSSYLTEGAFFTDQNNGCFIGRQGSLVITTDGGQSYTKETIGTTEDLKGVYFTDVHHGWVVGNGGVILKKYSFVEICLVTRDDITGKNLITWEKVDGMNIASYNVYKEITPGNYSLLGNVPFADDPEYIDYATDPNATAAKYKISFVDNSGIESEMSPYHQTICLGVSQGVPETTMTLLWSPYEDESGDFVPDYYYIHRGTEADNMTLHDSVQGTFILYNDINVLNTYYYKVSIKKDCGTVQEVESNVKDNDFSSVLEYTFSHELRIYPNPLSEYAEVEFENQSNDEYQFTIEDITGKTVQKYTTTGDKITIYRKDLSPGVYYVKGNGKKQYQGRIVIQ